MTHYDYSARNIIIGIDPGLTGGIALLNVHTGKASVSSMPIYNGSTLLKLGKPIVHGAELFQKLKWLPADCFLGCILEEVSAAPDQGVVSMFRFGESYGIVQGVLCALGLKVIKVRPSGWKSAMNLNSDKNKSLELARKLYPANSDSFKLKKNDGLAEALLLAHYGKRLFINESATDI